MTTLYLCWPESRVVLQLYYENVRFLVAQHEHAAGLHDFKWPDQSTIVGKLLVGSFHAGHYSNGANKT
jgi:hypothetical protein